MSFAYTLQQYSDQPILLSLLTGYSRPNDKIGELMKAGQITSLRKGLYVMGSKFQGSHPSPFLIANHLRGPSYVSLDSALAYWGLIPEKVYEISSLTTKTSKEYKTSAGSFHYYYSPIPYYSFGIKSVQLTEKQVVLMASPEKAICDKIIMTPGVLLRSQKQTHEFLLEDLRMDAEILGQLDYEAIWSWICQSSKKESLSMLVRTLKNL